MGDYASVKMNKLLLYARTVKKIHKYNVKQNQPDFK